MKQTTLFTQRFIPYAIIECARNDATTKKSSDHFRAISVVIFAKDDVKKVNKIPLSGLFNHIKSVGTVTTLGDNFHSQKTLDTC